MIKAVFFDMDGTVLDTIGTITHYVNVTLKKHGIPEISEDECKIFVGNGAKLLIERTLKSRGAYEESFFKKVLDEYNEAYDSAPTYKTGVFDGILPLFSRLRNEGIKIGIISNKPDFITRPLALRYFGDSVDFVAGAIDGVPLKPSPDSLISALKTLSATPDECVYVGDTSVDMITGKSAGAHLTVGVLWGFRKREELEENGADVIVNNPLQIYDEVMKLA